MERGPAALFGALVAVGLGPALWVGAQLGHREPPAPNPVVQSEQQQTTESPRGGAGAEADEPEPVAPPRNTADDKPVTKPKPKRSPPRSTEPPPASSSPGPSPSASSESTTRPDDTEPSGTPSGKAAEEPDEPADLPPVRVLPGTPNS